MSVNPRAASRPGAVLAVLSLAAFMASLDLFIVNVAFDDIGRDLARAGNAASLSHLSWVLNGYAIVYAALLVPLGRLADRFGRKTWLPPRSGRVHRGQRRLRGEQRVVDACGVPNVAGRGGRAADAYQPGPADQRDPAGRAGAGSTGVGGHRGSDVRGRPGPRRAAGGRVVAVGVPGQRPHRHPRAGGRGAAVPDVREDRTGPVPDLVGSAVLALGIGALALALVQGPDWGWHSAGVLGGFAIAILALATFARRCSVQPAPVIEVALLRVRAFAWSNVTSLVFSIAFAASLLTLVLWMQQVWGYSALQTGLAVAPGPLMVPVFAAVAQRLSRTVPVGRTPPSAVCYSDSGPPSWRSASAPSRAMRSKCSPAGS